MNSTKSINEYYCSSIILIIKLVIKVIIHLLINLLLHRFLLLLNLHNCFRSCCCDTPSFTTWQLAFQFLNQPYFIPESSTFQLLRLNPLHIPPMLLLQIVHRIRCFGVTGELLYGHFVVVEFVGVGVAVLEN